MSEELLSPFNLNFGDIIWTKQINLFFPKQHHPFGCLIYNEKTKKITGHFGNDVDTSKGSHYNVSIAEDNY